MSKKITPAGAAAVAGGVLVFGALLAFPALLLQRVTKARYDDWVNRFERIDLFRTFSRRFGQSLSRIPSELVIAIGLVLAALIKGFTDPGFGFTEESGRMYFSILLGICIESLAILSFLMWRIRSSGGLALLVFKPGSIVIVALAVAFSRLTGFQPGIVFGLVLTPVLVRSSPKLKKTSTEILEIVLSVFVGLLAWVGYSAIEAFLPSSDFAALALKEALALVTLGTLSTLPLIMMPIADFPGARLFKADRRIWAVLTIGVSAIFFIVVMPFPESWTQVDWPIVWWSSFFVGFALFAVAVWTIDLVLRRRAESVTVETVSEKAIVRSISITRLTSVQEASRNLT